MSSLFKYIIFILLLILGVQSQAQVIVNLTLKPPFTPYISDYTRPERIEDITITLFNQTSEEKKIKFKISLVNESKGIKIELKDNVVPKGPFLLGPNEFRFIDLEEVSSLYGKITQTDFLVKGLDIEKLILDGTIPDGLYEICVQAFDYNSTGFTSALSPATPSGCYSFMINYIDPPTDIRFNNNLLQYSYGGEVPKIGVNSITGQNFNIQFTPSPFNPGSSYNYELMIFEESAINPKQQQEATIINAIQTITPIIRKSSTFPFFAIDPSDVELDYNKNYYMVIQATDENEKALFKNKGFSAFKAFHLVDIKPIVVGQPQFTHECGTEFGHLDSVQIISWSTEVPEGFDRTSTQFIETQIRIMRYSRMNSGSSDILNVNINGPHEGTLIFDTIVQYVKTDELRNKIGISSDRMGKKEDNDQTKWVIAVQHRLNPLNATSGSHISFMFDGKKQCDYDLILGDQNKPLDFKLTHQYPMNNDTLPFMYVPVVIGVEDMSLSDQVVFTQFNSQLELMESNKYLFRDNNPDLIGSLTVLGFDTILGKVRRLLNEAAIFQHLGSFDLSTDRINEALRVVQDNYHRSTIDITDGIGIKNIPLGNPVAGKMAVMRRILTLEATNQLLGAEDLIRSYPIISNFIYIAPNRNNIMWTSKTGVYSNNILMNGGMTMAQYEEKFRNNSFSANDLKTPMLRQKLGSFSGVYNVGMKTPELRTVYNGRNLSAGKVSFRFLPSSQPQKIFPPSDKIEAWKTFDTFHVAQQWNLVVSRDRDFTALDTVISKRIVKGYAIKDGTAAIIKDLYSEVEVQRQFKDTGNYYWRVTWSKPTFNGYFDTMSKAEKDYYRQMLTLVGAAQTMGEETPESLMDLDPQKMLEYRFSKTDSFYIGTKDTNTTNVKVPLIELLYPLNGDTIPFLFPPVVFKNNQLDTSHRFVLSRFDSPLEPYTNHNYFLFDTTHKETRALMAKSYDSALFRLRSDLNNLAYLQMIGDDKGLDYSAMENEFNTSTEKRHFLTMTASSGSDLIILGHSSVGKMNLMRSLISRMATRQMLGEPFLLIPSLSGLIYTTPYKDISWDTKLAWYTDKGIPFTPSGFYDSLFINNQLHPGSAVSPENKVGITFRNGQFSVGMKTPRISEKLGGKALAKNDVKIRFIPSAMPNKLIPEVDHNAIWNDWSKLQVAQQWNVEVSNTPTFDTLKYVYSKCIIDDIDIRADLSKIQEYFYFEQTKNLDLNLPKGKYYYRITWSNPTDFDTSNPIHKSYMQYQLGIKALGQMFGLETSDVLDTDPLLNPNRINYKYSEIDSFFLLDTIVKRDTANCTMSCFFPIDDRSKRIFEGTLEVNEIVTVGNFKMSLTKIEKKGQTFSGEGRIECAMFLRPIGVEFSNIKFNEEKMMIEGKVKAKTNKDNVVQDLLSHGTMFDGIEKYVSELNADTSVLNAVSSGITEDVEYEKVSQIFNLINSPAVTLTSLAFQEELTMPFGLSKEVDQFPATIAVTDIDFMPDRATINAASILPMDIGFGQQLLGFGLKNICLTPGGLAKISNSGALELIGSPQIKLNDFMKMKIIGRNPEKPDSVGTKIVWDCKGYGFIDFVGELELDTNVVKTTNKEENPDQHVRITGSARINSLNNFLLEMSVNHPFEFKCLPGFTLTASKFAFDWTDKQNPAGMVFPTNYVGDKNNTWKGLFLSELGIQLPAAIEDKSTGNRLAFGAKNVLIDGTGITASIHTDNILNIDNGQLGGWAFSIGAIQLDILQNFPQSLSLSGKIGVPIMDGTFDYSMALQPSRNFDSLKMLTSITAQGTLGMPGWFAQLDIAEGSKLDISGDLANPLSISMMCRLNGQISLGGDDVAGMKDVRFGNLPFEGLTVKMKGFDLDSFQLNLEKLGGLSMNRTVGSSSGSGSSGSENTAISNNPLFNSPTNKAGGFPLNIKNFAFDEREEPVIFDFHRDRPGKRIGIRFTITLNVADAGAFAVGGSCGLGLYAFVGSSGSELEVAAGGIDIDTIKVNAKLSGVIEVAGGIVFVSNDSVYGNAVVGGLMATIQPALKIQVSGMFGQIESMRYWMVGAKIDLPTPIPIDFSAGVINANSFSGEAWYKMRRISGSAVDGVTFQLGKSPTGASFTPDDTTLFGFGAELGISGPVGTPLKGEVGLYAALNNAGGLSQLTIEGSLWMSQGAKEDASVLFDGNTTIDLDRKKLEGSLQALVNVAEVVRGDAQELNVNGEKFYVAGTVSLLIDNASDNWYIKAGDPFLENGRIGLSFWAGTQKMFSAGGYFMIGNKLSRELPPLESDFKRRLNELGITTPASISGSPPTTGFTIQMGVYAGVPEKKIELGVFYAGLSVDFTADGYLADGLLQNCGTRNGINGMYMNGEAYGIINGALGLHIESPFFTGDVIAAELKAGLKLKAGLLNPYYLFGNFKAHYSVLGGLIEGNRTFSFAVMEDPTCLPGAERGTMQLANIISESYPAQEEKEVIVGVEPSIALNYPLNEPQQIFLPVSVGGDSVRTDTLVIRLKYKNVSLKNENTKGIEAVRTDISEDKKELFITPVSYLKDNRTPYTLKANFYFQKYDASKEIWEDLKNGKKPIDTTLEISFTTEYEARIRPEYISLAAPNVGERYFKKQTSVTKQEIRPGVFVYKFENRDGFIEFEQSGIKETFFKDRHIDTAGRKFDNEYFIQWMRSGDDSSAISRITYSANSIHFPLPLSLNPDDMFELQIINNRKPVSTQSKTVSKPASQTTVGGVSITSGGGSSFSRDDVLAGGDAGTPRDRNTGGVPDIPDPMNIGGSSKPIWQVDRSEISVRYNKATVRQDLRILWYSHLFKCSKYNNMEDKINQISLKDSQFLAIDEGITVYLKTDEPFEEYEILSDTISSSLGGRRILSPLFQTFALADTFLHNEWIDTFYRKRVWNVFEILRKRGVRGGRPDLSISGLGASIVNDEEIMPKLPERMHSSINDLRNRALLLREFNNYQADRFSNSLANGIKPKSATTETVNIELEIDPATGELKPKRSGPLPVAPSSSGSGPSSSATQIEYGKKINVNYRHVYFMKDEFNVLKSTCWDIQHSASDWSKLGIYQRLVTNVNSREYKYYPPPVPAKFGIDLCSGGQSKLVKTVYISNKVLSIEDLTKKFDNPVSRSTTTFKSKTRF